MKKNSLTYWLCVHLIFSILGVSLVIPVLTKKEKIDYPIEIYNDFGINNTVNEPYIYEKRELPENSFGYAGTRKYINQDYFKSFFENNSGWSLEYFDDFWLDVTDRDLNVEIINPGTKEKNFLNITAHDTGRYRLRYDINQICFNYSFDGVFEYILGVDIPNSDEVYRIYFNWSDLVKSGLNLSYQYGFEDEKFYFIALFEDEISKGTFISIDPTFGDDSTGETLTIESAMRGLNVSCPASGLASSITVSLQATTPTHNTKCALYYGSNQTLVTNGATEQLSVSATAVYTFNFSTQPSLTAGEYYIITVWGQGTTGTELLVVDTTDSFNLYSRTAMTYDGNYPNPGGMAVTDSLAGANIYCTYTVTAPVFTEVWPLNASTKAYISTPCRVVVTDNDPSLTVNFYENSSGSWVWVDSFDNVVSGTNLSFPYTNANVEGKKYWWKVTAYDGANNVTGIYEFTTNNNTRFWQITDLHIMMNGGSSAPIFGDGRMDDLSNMNSGILEGMDTKYNNTPTGVSGGSSRFPIEVLNETVDFFNGNDTDVSFLVVTGDLVSQSVWTQGKNESLNMTKTALDSLDVQVNYTGAYFHDSMTYAGIQTLYESLFTQKVNDNFIIDNNLFVFMSETGELPYIDVPILNATLNTSADLGYNAIIFMHMSPSTGLIRDMNVAQTRGCLVYHKADYNTIVCIAGHSHMNGYVIEGGIHYVTTTALMNYPIMYRQVDIFNDHIRLHALEVPLNLNMTNLSYDAESVINRMLVNHTSDLDMNHPEYYYGPEYSKDITIGTRFISILQPLDIPGAYYTLDANMTLTTDYGFNVTADNVTFDLGNYYLNGSAEGSASNDYLIRVDGYNNFTLKGDYRGGYMTKSDSGVELNNSDGFIMKYVNVSNCTTPVFIKNSSIGIIKNITIRDSGQTFVGNGSITFESSTSFSVENITISNASCGLSFKSNGTYQTSDIDIVNCNMTSIKSRNISFTHINSGVGCSVNITGDYYNESDDNLLSGDILVRKHFLQVHTHYLSNSTTAGGVNVSLINGTGATISNSTTNSLPHEYYLGNSTNLQIIEYINYGGTKYYYNVYTLLAVLEGSGYGGSILYNVTTYGDNYTQVIPLDLIPFFHSMEAWNGTLYNKTSWGVISNWNGTLYNSTKWNTENIVNGSIYNTSYWINKNILNGSIYNLSGWINKELWNGSLYNDQYFVWDSYGRWPDVVRLNNSQYYLIVASGGLNRGWAYTIFVDNDTNYVASVDSLQFDPTTANIFPSVVQIPGTDNYAISYVDTGPAPDELKVVTLKALTTNGNIAAAVTDTITISNATTYPSTASRSNIIHVSGDIYAVIYNSSFNLTLVTIDINSDGTIENNILQGQVINGSATYPYMSGIDDDTIAISYTGPDNDGYLVTYNISNTGLIEDTPSQEWEFNPLLGFSPFICHAIRDIYILAYRDNTAGLILETVRINETGFFMNRYIDTLTLTESVSMYLYITSISDKDYLISYQGPDDDGYITRFSIGTDGFIDNDTYTVEFDTSDSQYRAPITWINNTYFLTVYEGLDNAGSVYILNVATNNTAPSIVDVSPRNNSIYLPLNFTYRVFIDNINGSFNYTIQCSNSNNTSGNNVLSGDKFLNISGLNYGTNYTVWVNSSKVNSDIYTNETFNFTTVEESNSSLINLLNFGGKSIMWIQAHTDDEFMLSGLIPYAFDKGNEFRIMAMMNNSETEYGAERNDSNNWLNDTYLEDYIYLNIDLSTADWALVTTEITSKLETYKPDIIITTSPLGYSSNAFHASVQDSVNSSYVNLSYSPYLFWVLNYGEDLSPEDREDSTYIATDRIGYDSYSFDLNKTLWEAKVDLWEHLTPGIGALNILVLRNESVMTNNSRAEYYYNVTFSNVLREWTDSESINGSLYNSSSFSLLTTWNGSLYNTVDFSLISTLNGSLYNRSAWALNNVWKGSLYNSSRWSSQNNWNGTLYNNTFWSLFSSFNGSLFNISSFNPVSSWNGSIYNLTRGVWTEQNHWNGTLYNITTFKSLSYFNGTLYNISGNRIITTFNGSIFNSSSWGISSMYNGTIYNISHYSILSSFNGSIYNSSSFKSFMNWNGTIYNLTRGSWSNYSTINGSIYNISHNVLVGTWNGSIYNFTIGSWSTKYEINGTIQNISSWSSFGTINGSIYNLTLGNWVVYNYINGSIYNTTNFRITSQWNGTLYNLTKGNWVNYSLFNGTIYNLSNWNLLFSINGSIYNSSLGVWSNIESYNGTIYNSSRFNYLSGINGTLYNISRSNNIASWNGSLYNISFNTLIVSLNGTLYNKTSWGVISNWNGSLYNLSSSISIQTWNGTIYNSSISWNILSEYNGTIYNFTNFKELSLWNGTIYNISNSNIVSSLNGTLYNSTFWVSISEINGSIFNSSVSGWAISNTWNGSVFNQSHLILITEFNGTLYNISSSSVISIWNGTLYNSCEINLISSWNGSIYNNSKDTTLDSWNGSIFNSTLGVWNIYSSFNGTLYNISYQNIISEFNGTIFNLTTNQLISEYNGTLFNSTKFNDLSLWNGSLYNISYYWNDYDFFNVSIYNLSLSHTLDIINGSLYNISYWGMKADINGSIFNLSREILISSYNGSIYNSSSFAIYDSFNGTLYNTSIWINITTWNGSLYNISLFDWEISCSYNGSIYNLTEFNILSEFNGSLYNSSSGTWKSIVNINGSLYNITDYNNLSLFNGSIFNLSLSTLLSLWNGSIYNSSTLLLIDTWNGTLYNLSSLGWSEVSSWNGTILNSPFWSSINDINGSLRNSTRFISIDAINGTIFNSTVSYKSITFLNGSLYNTSRFMIINNTNGTIYNSTRFIVLGIWSGTIYNTTSNMEWNGTISHVDLNVNVTCNVNNGYIECTACKEGRLNEYKWEIRESDGTLTGSTEWVRWDGVSPIIFSSAFYSENLFDIFIFARNDYNETENGGTSVSSQYTLPDLPPEEPDSDIVPNKPVNIDDLPEAGEYKNDTTEILGFRVNNFLLFLILVAVFFLFLRFYLKWRKSVGKN